MSKSGKNLKIEVNGINICYDDLGSGEIPLIFIHGFPFDKSSWQFQMEGLKTQYRVIAYDCRGYGNSSFDDKAFSIDLFADDLILFMDALSISKASICGLSMGGYVALNAVGRYAERFHKLILSDTQCNNDNDEAKEKRYKAIDFLNKGGIVQYADTFIKNLFTESTFASNAHLITQIKSGIVSTRIQSITSTLSALAERSETCSNLKDIKVPSLIICGKHDVITPPVKSEYLHENINNSILKIIDNAGHLSSMEQPAEFNKFILQFLHIN